MRVINKVLVIILIAFLMLSISSVVYAEGQAPGYWKEVWDIVRNEKLTGDCFDLGIDGFPTNIALLTENDMKKLSNSNNYDRAAYLQIVEKRIDDNSATSDFSGEREKLVDILNKMKGLANYFEQKGEPYIDGEKKILGIKDTNTNNGAQTGENGNGENSGGDDVITAGEAAENANRIEEINNILNSGMENGVEITDERRAELEAERQQINGENAERADEVNNKSEQSILDRQPIGLLAQNNSDGKITMDDTIDGAMDFVNSGQDDIIVQDRLQEVTSSLYNILLVIAMVVAIVTGLIIAIKFMMSGVEGKAEVKKVLVPYVISCAVTFGAFGIWKLVVEILNNLE